MENVPNVNHIQYSPVHAHTIVHNIQYSPVHAHTIVHINVI